MSDAGKPERLMSLDAYRGLIMLAMASSGFAFAKVAQDVRVLNQYEGTQFADAWFAIWKTLGYQFGHVAWTGCSFWDLIQPSFMFMVGVAMPFSYARRQGMGHSSIRLFGHVLFRSLVLVALGVFLASNGRSQTNFVFTNVLSQIGLGYPFLYLYLGRRPATQLMGIAVILGGYWYFFYQYNIPEAEFKNVTQYLQQVEDRDASDWTQFTGHASHWNKHTNAAAAVDRKFLSRFPREEKPWHGRTYWVNKGGYQSLNFIPSLATMLFGLMAGQLLRGPLDERDKFNRLFISGGVCLILAMAIDTNIWPVAIQGCNWSLCPIVKRIWTPSWAVFSTGWTLWMLAALYWIIDIKQWRRWTFPLIVVGMNSIAMYCMSQMIKPWAGRTLKTHLATLDAFCGCERGISFYLFDSTYPYATVFEYTARLFVLWLICLWMYRKKIFIRI